MLFVPDLDGQSEEVFWYCLAVSARRHRIDVHVAMLMSNHLHLVITDVAGLECRFYAMFHRLLALCTKARLGWPEEVFNKSKTSGPHLVSNEAVLKSMAYAIANPVTAGLVRRAADWPGARTSAKDLGARVVKAKRPRHFFRGTDWPRTIELPLTIPASLLAEMEPEEVRRRVQARVRQYEKEALTRSKDSGLRLMYQ